MNYERILLERDGNLATITLNHPEVLNATDARMIGELADAVLRIRDPESGVRAFSSPARAAPSVPAPTSPAGATRKRGR